MAPRKIQEGADGKPTGELLQWTITTVRRMQNRLGLLT